MQEALYNTKTLRVPRVVTFGDYTGGSFLATEFLDFSGRSAADQAALGTRLAKMHAADPQARFSRSRC